MSRPSTFIVLCICIVAAALLVPLATVADPSVVDPSVTAADPPVTAADPPVTAADPPATAADPPVTFVAVTALASCGNGVCELGEDCETCPSDCLAVVPAPPFCGDGICEPDGDEDCLNCDADCAGQQTGNPSNRYCCGGGGTGPVDCEDSRCTSGGYACHPSGGFCCGDGVCDEGETIAECAIDCG